jgi:hypothetical protein
MKNIVEAHTLIAPTDKRNRLANRNLIEHYANAVRNEFDDAEEFVKDIDSKGLVEWFVHGAYVRQLTIPKETTIVSDLWNRERLWVIVKGDVSVTSELGNTRIKAPYIGMAPFGSKVALYTHEETVWLAITGAESTTSEEVKEEVRAKDYNEVTYPWELIEYKGDT